MRTPLFLPLLALISFAPPLAAETEETPFRIGLIRERSNSASYMFDLYNPLFVLLQEHLAPHGIRPGMVLAADQEELRQRVAAGEVEAVLESLFNLLRMPAGQLEPWIVAERKGERQVSSVIFVAADSPIADLRDLAGKRIAFESPRSTSAYAIPRAMLERAGLGLAPDGQEDAPAQAVRYRFAGDERTQAYWVSLGQTEAGGFNDSDWVKLPESLRGRLRVIAQSRPFLRWLFYIHSGVSPAVKAAMQKVLLALPATPTGRQALAQAKITDLALFLPADQALVNNARDLLGLRE